MKIINNINFNKKQLKNAVVDLIDGVPATPTEGQIWFNTGVTTPANKGLYIYKSGSASRLTDQTMTTQQIVTALEGYGVKINIDVDKLDGYDASAFYLATTPLNSITAPTGSVSLNSQKITNLGTPTANSTDAATTSYVDDKVAAYVRGLDPKESVNFAYEVPINLVGQNIIVEGIFLTTGMRVLATAQANASTNGIYIVGAGGWVRATDADPVGGTLTLGAHTFEETSGKGYVYKGSDLWVRFDERKVVSAGTGIVVSTVGTTSTISVDTTYVPKRAKSLIGNGSDTQFTLTHGFGTSDVVVSVREVATGAIVLADVTVTSDVQIQIDFDTAPANNAYGVVIIG